MSIDPLDFFNLLQKSNITFFTGIPDSLLKEFNNVILQNTDNNNHIITSNEGSSIALATGYHLATNNIPLVYLQNSGLGNTINPLLSLASEDVYSIPMILLIGWRGEPNIKDEPQHISQGKCMESIINSIYMPYYILPNKYEDVTSMLKEILESMKIKKKPHIILVKKNLFSKYDVKIDINNKYNLFRKDVLTKLMNIFDKDVIVSTTGTSSRELLQIYEDNNKDLKNLFLNVGAMGHVSMISQGIAMNTDKRVICIDGDGSVIMHMGNLTSVGTSNLKNYIHIVINNGMHQSVGIQPTNGFNINLKEIALGCNYKFATSITNNEEFDIFCNSINNVKCPAFIEIRVSNKKNYNTELPRPKLTPKESKINFMNFIN